MYNLFFQPIIDIFKYIYLFIVKLTGNYGISLILLSVIVNIILRPISNWAAKIQDKERKIQEILAPQIAEIKKNYHGAEQHAELSELYKRYGYNPLYAIRSGLDLFIQLPLLTAAYIMLSSLEVLNGQTFGIIKNLANPDNLFMGINILPVLMTFINFLVTLTTKNFTKRERVQAFIIAILFLILLYDAPSALLIYWTTNNFIMLLKNFAGIKILKTSGEKISGVLGYRYTPSIWWVGGVKLLTFALVIISIGAYFYYLIGYAAGANSVIMRTSAYNFVILFSFVFAWMLFTGALEQDFYISEIIIKIAYLLGGCALLFLYLRHFIFIAGGPVIPQVMIGRIFLALTVVYVSFAFLLPVSYKKLLSQSYSITDGRETSLFFASIISLTVFFCIFAPSVIYQSDPVMFSESLSLPELIGKISAYGVIFIITAVILWLILPLMLRRMLSVLTALCACIFFVNAFILTENSGGVDLIRISGIFDAIRKDLCSTILSVLFFVLIIYKKRVSKCVQGFVLLSLAMIGVGIYCNINVAYYGGNNLRDGKLEQESLLPSFHDELWEFSRNNKNVIGIFLDAFTGDHVYKIIEDDPELAKRLDGFIYFPDTVSVGNLTFFSTPSIYGGPNYNPVEHNRIARDRTMLENFVEAYATLPNAFAKNGYDVAIADLPFLYKIEERVREKMDKSVLFLGDGMGVHYSHYWETWASQNNIEYQMSSDAAHGYILMWSFMRGIPFSMRVGVAEHLKNLNAQFYFKQSFMPNIYIQFMKDFVNIREGNPKLKIIYNILTHPTWFLSANSLQPVLNPANEAHDASVAKGITPAHYYTERHVLHFIADFVETLKNFGIYDNTRIVIFSDHDAGDSWILRDIFDNDSYPGSPNSLMLFKDFNSHGTMQISDALMSCQDAPALISGGIVSIDGIPSMERLKTITGSDRVRTHSTFFGVEQPFNDRKYDIKNMYEITGTIFKKENWREVYNAKK